MAFAIERAEAADDICDIIISSLMLPMTPVPRKLARLHLVADILANSSAPVPSAWKYRSAFEPKLGAVFDHLNDIYKTFPGRMKANVFKNQIMAVINIWEAMLVFTPSVIEGFTKRLNEGRGAGEGDFDEEGEPIDDGEPLIAEATNGSTMRGFMPIAGSKTGEIDVDGAAID